MTTADFPYDLDTTSIALTVAPHFTDEIKHNVMDEIVNLKNKDDIVQTYFDITRPRIGQLNVTSHYFIDLRNDF